MKNRKKGKKARTQKQQSKKEEVKQKKNSLEEKEVRLKWICHENFFSIETRKFLKKKLYDVQKFQLKVGPKLVYF